MIFRMPMIEICFPLGLQNGIHTGESMFFENRKNFKEALIEQLKKFRTLTGFNVVVLVGEKLSTNCLER